MEALSIQRQNDALALGVHRRLLRPVQKTGSLAEIVAFGQHRDCDEGRRFLDHHTAAASLDEEEAVPGLPLVDDHLARGYADAAKTACQGTKHSLRQSEENSSLLQHGHPRHHVVIRRPTVFRTTLQDGKPKILHVSGGRLPLDSVALRSAELDLRSQRHRPWMESALRESPTCLDLRGADDSRLVGGWAG